MNKYEHVPEWYLTALYNLESEGWRPDFSLERFRDRFVTAPEPEAVRSPGAVRGRPGAATRPGMADVIMGMGGELIEAAVRLLAPAGPLCMGARSLGAAAAGVNRSWSTSKNISDQAAVTCAMVVTEGAAVNLEINMVENGSGTEIRPFTVAVFDESGIEITDPITVRNGDLPPRFPSPSAGWYRFAVTWPGGAGDLVVQVR